MRKKEIYTLYTTKGNEITRTREELIDIYCKQYLQKNKGITCPTPKECEDEIDDFVTRFKLVEE